MGINTDLSLIQNIENMTDWENVMHSEQVSTLVLYSQGDKNQQKLIDELNSIRFNTHSKYSIENPKFNIFKLMSEKIPNLSMGLGQSQSPSLQLINKGNIASKWVGWPDLNEVCDRIQVLNYIKFDDVKINEKLTMVEQLIKNNSIEEAQFFLQEILQNHSKLSELNFKIRILILKTYTKQKQIDQSVQYLTEIYQDQSENDELITNPEFVKLKAMVEVNQMIDDQDGEFKEQQIDQLSHQLSLDQNLSDDRKVEILNRLLLMYLQEGNREMAFNQLQMMQSIESKKEQAVEISEKLFDVIGRNSEWSLQKKKLLSYL